MRKRLQPEREDGVLVSYSDASVGTAKGGASQGARIMGLCPASVASGLESQFSVLHGHSHRLRRKCASSLAAETYAASEAMGEMEFAERFILEVGRAYPVSRPLWPSEKRRCRAILVTDSKSLYDHVHKGGSGACVQDKRCAIELSVLSRCIPERWSVR